jgi:hypothetical protein
MNISFLNLQMEPEKVVVIVLGKMQLELPNSNRFHMPIRWTHYRDSSGNSSSYVRLLLITSIGREIHRGTSQGYIKFSTAGVIRSTVRYSQIHTGDARPECSPRVYHRI